MAETDIAKANPHWFEEPRLLSAPGQGAHPRGMAIDVTMVKSGTNEILDCGTAFDYLTPDPANNPAERHHAHLSHEARANRQLLDDLMLGAAHHVGIPLHPLSTEWWDYRMPMGYWKDYAPLSDAELPEPIRMAAQAFS
ncbi:MAG: M15 family metallopeptidase, partial [Pseudobdellovibrionaceae bacterium]